MTTAAARAARWGWTWQPGLEHRPGWRGAWTAPWHGGFLVYAAGLDFPPHVTPEKASRGVSRAVWTAAQVQASGGQAVAPAAAQA